MVLRNIILEIIQSCYILIYFLNYYYSFHVITITLFQGYCEDKGGTIHAMLRERENFEICGGQHLWAQGVK